MIDSTVVIPCFNEASRLSLARMVALGSQPGVHLLFVDDGSTDGTHFVLQRICDALPAGRGRVLALERNVSKAEAVRRGLLAAVETSSALVGYLDADLATPGEEMVRLLRELESSGARVALGSRIQLLGASIERSAARHWLGRVFARCASLVLGLPVYDTQCGAKVFRNGPELARALAEPFHARWAFDVELIGRLHAFGLVAEDFLEVPLRRWTAVGGSSLRPSNYPLLGVELIRIWMALEQLRYSGQKTIAAPQVEVDAREDVA